MDKERKEVMVTLDPINWKYKIKLFDRYFDFYLQRIQQFIFIHIGWLYIIVNKSR